MSALHDLARRIATWAPQSDFTGPRTLDAVGALVAGSKTEEGAAIAASLRHFDSGVSAAVVRRVATARLSELDDIHMASCTTPGSVVVPTAITLGEFLGAEPAAYRRAVEVGYEAMTRLGSAIAGAQVVYHGIWPTYFCAPFAAAAVVGALVDLDAPRLANALGIALTRATGLTSGIAGAPLGRWLTIGEAARAGCAAAFAARDGFVSEVDLGRIAAAAGVALDVTILQEDAPLAIGQVSIKPFPIAKQSLAAVEATLLLGEGVGPGPIRVYVPDAYAEMIATLPSADSRLIRLSSARWNIALALRQPEELHDVERSASPGDAVLAHTAANVEIFPDPRLSCFYPGHWSARVEVSGRSETVVEATGDPPQGNDLAAVEAKWRERPEQLQAVLGPCLMTDLGQLSALLDNPENFPLEVNPAYHGSAMGAKHLKPCPGGSP
jgi:2-methylcitrate dehydratase PrpD